MSIWRNIRKRGLKDVFNPKKWRIFLRYLRKTVASHVPGQVDAEEMGISKATLEEYSELSTPHELEQIVWRMSQEGCRPCLRSGECTHCGCKSPDLFYDRENWCSGNHWSRMMSRLDWAEHKKIEGIEIDPFLFDQVVETGIISKFKNE